LNWGKIGFASTVFLPGMTQTGRVDKLLAARADAKGHDIGTETEQAAENIPLGRIGTPEEFANTAVLCVRLLVDSSMAYRGWWMVAQARVHFSAR
jgi:NAD(P)-dependent dehydrogenase (short-subunit alcohol dehydrogenase family)